MRLLASRVDHDLLVVLCKIKDDVSQLGLVLVGRGPLHAKLRDQSLAVWVQTDTCINGLCGATGDQKHDTVTPLDSLAMVRRQMGEEGEVGGRDVYRDGLCG